MQFLTLIVAVCICSLAFADTMGETTLPKFSWPVWPDESEAIGASEGPFPFWCDTSKSEKGAFKFTCLDREEPYKTPARTRLLYSYSRMQQITYRDDCDLTEFGGEKGVQCAHRFQKDGTAFITYGDRKDGYCCQSFGHLPQSNPLPIPHPSFMDTCLLKSKPMFYNGTYYQGMVYNYTDEFAELPTYFWYLTAAGDPVRGEWPIEQGEGCTMDWANKDLCTAKGATSKLGPRVGDPPPTRFQYEKFEETIFADAEFDLPEVCTGDKLKQCYNMECDSSTPQSTTGMRALDPTFNAFMRKGTV